MTDKKYIIFDENFSKKQSVGDVVVNENKTELISYQLEKTVLNLDFKFLFFILKGIIPPNSSGSAKNIKEIMMYSGLSVKNHEGNLGVLGTNFSNELVQQIFNRILKFKKIEYWSKLIEKSKYICFDCAEEFVKNHKTDNLHVENLQLCSVQKCHFCKEKKVCVDLNNYGNIEIK